MSIHTTMPAALKPFYKAELEKSANAFSKKEYALSWHHLERAHIFSQPYPIAHTSVHWKMLLFGLRKKNGKEVIGQVSRLLLGGVISFIGKAPTGNTGGANVPPFKKMQIPADIQSIIDRTKT